MPKANALAKFHKANPHILSPEYFSKEQTTTSVKRKRKHKPGSKLKYVLRSLFPKCYICGVRPGNTSDHVKPKSKGGMSRRNKVPCCGPCNTAKGNRWPYACELLFCEVAYEILDHVKQGEVNGSRAKHNQRNLTVVSDNGNAGNCAAGQQTSSATARIYQSAACKTT